MVLDQKSGSVSSSESSTTVIGGSTGIPASIDMGWTTADAKNASVWKGPDVWRANWDQNQMDFHSAVIVGENNKAVVVTEPEASVTVVDTGASKHPALHGKA